jgi:hypothetical protein
MLSMNHLEVVMITKILPVFRGLVTVGYLGMIGLMMACMAFGLGSSTVEQGILQLDNGVINIRNQDGGLEPLAGTSTFELIGTLESVEPWTVSGRVLQRNASTQIAQGLQVGDLVRVRGAALEDDNWLAYSIEPAEQQTAQTVILIGKVTSTEPWIVNGITLQVTNDTVINGDIVPNMLVRVEILLLEDGTWEVISISPLGNIPSASGCATVIATVAHVNGNQIQFVGWPTPVTVVEDTPTDNATNDNNTSTGEENDDEEVDITTLKPGQQVLAVICVSDNNEVVITKITRLNVDDNETEGREKVLVCHKPNKKGGHTISIASPAVPAHLAHGDTLGPCP